MNIAYGNYGAYDKEKCALAQAKLDRYRTLKPYPWNLIAIASIPGLKKKIPKLCNAAKASDPMYGIPGAPKLPKAPKAASPGTSWHPKQQVKDAIQAGVLPGYQEAPPPGIPMWAFALAGVAVVGLGAAYFLRKPA